MTTMLRLSRMLWVIVWKAFLVNVSGATKMMFQVWPFGPPQCKSTGISSFITSAQITYLGGKSSSQVSALSHTHCAIRSNMAAALGFFYEDGVCTVHGPGERTSLRSALYRPLVFPTVEDLEEVARNKETYATTEYLGLPGHLAVDGDISGSSLYASAYGEANPWWIVDIGENRTIYQIQIYPRIIAAERFHDIEIRIGATLREDGDLSTYKVISYYIGPYATSEGCVICSSPEGIEGRYISIQKVAVSDNVDILQFLEVSIFALKL